MPLSSEISDYVARRPLGSEDQPTETGFFENAALRRRAYMDENHAFSEYFSREMYTERNQQIQKLHESGTIPQEVWEMHAEQRAPHRRAPKTDYNALSEYLKAQGHEIENDDELADSLRADLKTRREEMQRVGSRASFMGEVGGFVGDVAGMATDPPMWAGAAGAPMRVPLLARVAAGMALSAGTEAVAQTGIVAWKQKIDSPYTTTEALGNVALAGLFGGTAELAAEGLKRIIPRLRKTPDGDDAADAAEWLLREQEQAPPGTSAKEHEAKITQGVDDINKGDAPVRTEPTSVLDSMDDTEVDTIFEATVETAPDLAIPGADGVPIPARQAVAELDDDVARLSGLRECLGG